MENKPIEFQGLTFKGTQGELKAAFNSGDWRIETHTHKSVLNENETPISEVLANAQLFANSKNLIGIDQLVKPGNMYLIKNQEGDTIEAKCTQWFGPPYKGHFVKQ